MAYREVCLHPRWRLERCLTGFPVTLAHCACLKWSRIGCGVKRERRFGSYYARTHLSGRADHRVDRAEPVVRCPSIACRHRCDAGAADDCRALFIMPCSMMSRSRKGRRCKSRPSDKKRISAYCASRGRNIWRKSMNLPGGRLARGRCIDSDQILRPSQMTR